jgi:hypothetical protein
MRRPLGTGSRRRPAAGRARPAAQGSQIKVTRNKPRPQIEASRGPGGPAKRRTVAQPPRDNRVAETRRQSINSIGARPPAKRRAPAPRSGTSAARSAGRGAGSGGVRAVSAGAGGAAAAVRVVQEAARPVGAVTRPVLRVVSGGLEALPRAAGRATPVARGRLLILLAGVLAAGLIYINVGKLEYGDGYAKYADRAVELQRENTQLRSRIANLSSAERIQRYAAGHGMMVPAPEQYTYLRPHRGDALKGSRGYSAPLVHAAPSTGVTASTGVPAPDAAATPATGGL